jgi:hypothetical protein
VAVPAAVLAQEVVVMYCVGASRSGSDCGDALPGVLLDLLRARLESLGLPIAIA